MSTNDTTGTPGSPVEFPPIPGGQTMLSGPVPRRGKARTREQRQAKLRHCGLVMLCIMACVLVLSGAAGSIKWDNPLTRTLYPNADHRYAMAAVNLSTGLIFWVALIGIYLPAHWGLKLNVIGCLWYLVGTVLLEIWEGSKVAWTESISDIVFWSTFPVIQIVCILVGSSETPARETPDVKTEVQHA